jgi:hypothetical protein
VIPFRSRSIVLGLAGLLLAIALFVLARPRQIVSLVGTASWSGLAVAFAWGCGVLLARGVRLAVLLAPKLSVGRAAAVVGVVQCAASVLPLRLGELAMPPLLDFAGVRGLVRGLAYAVLVRLMDVAALLVWAVLALFMAGGSLAAETALAGALVVFLGVAGLATRLLPRLVRRFRRGGRLRRAALRQILEVRRELRLLRRSPARALGAFAASIVVWGGLWGLTASLLNAMHRPWPPSAVLAGVVGAAVGSSLPINAVGSFGTLEAGWTAAAAAFGMPAGQALADGFATHLWSLAFSLAFAAPAAAYLAISHRGIAARYPRADLVDRRRNDVGP